MNHDDPAEALGGTVPDEGPPPRFDLDQVVEDGYRMRRRSRAALAGSAALGVTLLAAATAFAAGLGSAPSGPDVAGEFGFDPAAAGYPYDVHWGQIQDEEDGSWSVDSRGEAGLVAQTATETFGPLLAETGLWDDAVNTADEEECAIFEESAPEVYEDCLGQPSGLAYGWIQSPANGGQVYLRGYRLLDSAEAPSFTVEAMLPGGWTSEPGPVGEQEFPRHLIDDEGAEFTNEELDDGRTLMVAERDCAYELAVVYPNGSGLRVSWDTGCEGARVDLGKLTDAALAMPEFDFDTTGLAPIDEALDVPQGWEYDEEWPARAVEDAQASVDAAMAVVEERHPGAEGHLEGPEQTALAGSESVGSRFYTAAGTLPLLYGPVDPVDFTLRYALPGGWVEGYATDPEWGGPYLSTCGNAAEVCDQFDVDGRTVVTVTESLREEYSYTVYVFDPDGWAVELGVTVPADEGAVDIDALVRLAAALPAPVYETD